ncbi:hypothetical protein C1H46_028616 [Malus baccata]|uniref:Uncharacterized protein n=1 Tax=Malus baccata TaxID=106549 RepID=A0A540LH88_MALBA|nr:hypothetical protein C1H46_028616 [Malus baccata]
MQKQKVTISIDKSSFQLVLNWLPSAMLSTQQNPQYTSPLQNCSPSSCYKYQTTTTYGHENQMS